jgi:hypothetical protein
VNVPNVPKVPLPSAPSAPATPNVHAGGGSGSQSADPKALLDYLLSP